ncbi:MAG: hypothetical protein ACKOZW_01675 [Cyanobium sp.]
MHLPWALAGSGCRAFPDQCNGLRIVWVAPKAIPKIRSGLALI